MQGVDDGLAEGQVVLRAGRHHCGPQRLRPSIGRFGRGCRGGGCGRLCLGGGLGGLGCLRLGGFGLGLSLSQRGLKFGDNFGVDRSFSRIHGFRKGRLGFGGGCGSLFSPGGGRICLGLGGCGLRLRGGRFGLCCCRGRFGFGLSSGGVSVRGVVGVVTA